MKWLRARVGHDNVLMPAAAGLVRDTGGRALLQRRSDNGLWGFPGGMLELGESAQDAATREVREETGLVVEPRRLIGIYTSPAFSNRYPNGDQVQPFIAFFECEATGGTLELQPEEVLELAWFDLASPPEMTRCCAAKAADAVRFEGEAFFR